MAVTRGASTDRFPVAAVIDAIDLTEAASERAKFGLALDRALKALERRRKELEAFYELAAEPDVKWQEIVELAELITSWGRNASERLRPRMDALQQKLERAPSRMPPEVREVRKQGVGLAEDFLALYADMRNRLMHLAAERRPLDAVMRAKPVEGEVDHEVLSREFMVRFPKLRAALAK